MKKLQAALVVTDNELEAHSPGLRRNREQVMQKSEIRARAANALPHGRGGAAAVRAEEHAQWIMSVSPSPAVYETVVHNLKCQEQLPAFEVSAAICLNELRVLLGLNPLRWDLKLHEAALAHCRDMTENGFRGHRSPIEGKHRFGDRARLAGTSAHAENIAYGVRSGEEAVWLWFGSPGHHINMFGPYTRMGFAHLGDKCTLMLGR
jgi:uncharacterized protein YkwD